MNAYCEISGTRSYGGEALASSCVLRHMNSCRIFHYIHSITYNNSTHWRSVNFDSCFNFLCHLGQVYLIFFGDNKLLRLFAWLVLICVPFFLPFPFWCVGQMRYREYHVSFDIESRGSVGMARLAEPVRRGSGQAS